LFPKQLGKYPGTFNGLVQTYAERIQQISGPPEMVFDDAGLTVSVQDKRLSLAVREYALLTFLAERCRDGLPPYGAQKDALPDFGNWLTAWGRRFDPVTRQRETVASWGKPSDDDIRKLLSSLRAKFKRAGLGSFEPFLLPQRGAFGIRVRVVR
jgi:hypothetical protein